MSALGLDIGSSSIKLIALSGNIKVPRLDAFGLAVNPVGNVETENDAERVQIAQAVKKLVADAGVKEKKVVAALPEAKVFTRVVEMPVLSESELASAVNWEAEQYIPIPISEVQLDYRILSKPEGRNPQGKMQVFLVAAPTTSVEKMVKLLDLAGLEAEALETEILGVTRALIREENLPPILIVHMGAGTTDLSLIEKGVIVFTRSIPTGGNALSRALANELGLEPLQAEQYKRTYGLDGNQLQGKVRKALLAVFQSILGEIRKAMYFYTTNRRGKIGRVVLSGGGSYLPEFTGELARELGVEVVVANPFAGIAMDPRQQKRIGGVGAVFSVAIGLAMRGI